MTELTAFVNETLPVITALNDENWDQDMGTYGLTPRCCIGAHLANHFRVAKWPAQDQDEAALARLPRYCLGTDWQRGRAYAAIAIGCTGWQVDALLHAAGAPEEPFSPDPWPVPPTTVWQNLTLIKGLPSSDGVVAWITHYRSIFEVDQ